MRVLIATDGSPHAAAAMTAACRILSPEERCVDLMCVAPEPKQHSKHQPTSEKLQHRAAKILSGARHAMAEQGVSARTLLEHGSAVKNLLRASLQYDVTVVGAKSRKDNSPAGLGPVASRLIEHATTSVLIGREGRNDTGVRILAPVDGSGLALDALEKLASLVDLKSSEVTLMHVVETPWLIGPDPPESMGEEDNPGDPQAQLAYELEREAEDVIEEARDRLPPRTAVNRVIERGLPANAILAEADGGDYDLVLMAASGSNDMKHQLLGSVSYKVAWNAPCSVLLIRSSA
jgi:nucleotide-binding universal stress UspA family protein